jgi:lysozyme
VEFYHFSHVTHTPENTPALEAGKFLAIVKKYFKPGDVVNLDWECASGCDLSRGDLALEWMNIVKADLKCKVRFYTYQSMLLAHILKFAVIRLAGYPLWLASYPTALAGKGFGAPERPTSLAPGWNIEVYQYSSTGKLPGYAGDLDLNRMYLTVDTAPDPLKIIEQVRTHAEAIIKVLP